jgi:tRNA-dihydrouridine synthase
MVDNGQARAMLELAPLHGITNRIFRRIYFRYFSGFDAAMAPFIVVTADVSRRPSRFEELRPDPDNPITVVPQLLGNHAGSFVATARLLADMGYREVNWNLGCPFPMVMAKDRGAGLLPYPERIAAFLDAVCSASALPVSVKLRLGRRDAGEIQRIIPILDQYPLARLIVHPRLATQLYAGSVDLDSFAEALRCSTQPIVYSGDIRDVTVFQTLHQRFPRVQGWMIGRWALADPFLPGRIKGLPAPVDPPGIVRQFHAELYAAYQQLLVEPGHVLGMMKGVWHYLAGQSDPTDLANPANPARPTDPGTKALASVLQAVTLQAYDAAVQAYFEAAARQTSPQT